MKTKKKQEKKLPPQRAKLRDLPAKKNPKGGAAGPGRGRPWPPPG
jgi:hypothetical protein